MHDLKKEAVVQTHINVTYIHICIASDALDIARF